MRVVARARGQAGFSMAELLVVLAVLGFIIGAVVTVVQSGINAYALGSARIDVQESARIALDRMTRDLREALAMTGQSATGVTLQYDWDKDGVVDAAPVVFDGVLHGPTVTYSWAGAGSPLLRQEQGIDAQPQEIVSAVESLSLTYPAANRVVIAIQTAPEGVAVAGSAGTSRAEMTTEVALRNTP